MHTAAITIDGAVDQSLRRQYALQVETSKVADILCEYEESSRDRYQEIAKLSSILDSIKNRPCMHPVSYSMWPTDSFP
jgi:hypothetical protein